ncbi:hypothetical protein F5Y04DRAFT_289376 [Hypomontagnella monticulosa]|nr:hypothetical protein F5Y04DRAFT_289376 [Hypomontagnella monticulosa]
MDTSSAADWISAASSIAATVIGIMTLVTVYIGAMQILSQTRMYRVGLSHISLGPWKSKAAHSALFGLQRRISTPSVSLKFLVKNQWSPKIVFPTGFSRQGCTEKGDNIQAKASWVNFMQALALTPADDTLYEMQDASELVNGIVPMRWTGQDLAGMCSILGFQSHETNPSYRSPMPLPMQWSGPLGWIQFRSSENGCVAEFRRRMDVHNLLPPELHKYYISQGPDMPQEPHYLISRLWNSINGLSLKEGSSLYLGGADRCDQARDDDDEEDAKTPEQIVKDLMSADLPKEDIRHKLFGKRGSQPAALRREVDRVKGGGRPLAGKYNGDDEPDFLRTMFRDAMEHVNKKEVLRPCPGLLSVSLHGELADNRGLSIETSREYDRKYTEAEDVDHHKYPYNLGDLYMDGELLALLKEALLLLRPDGFYFSPTPCLFSDLDEVYKHIKEQSKALFPDIAPNNPKTPESSEKPGSTSSTTSSTSSFPDIEWLRYGVKLCNELQRTRKTGRAYFSVEDMQLLSKAVRVLWETVSPSGQANTGDDLVWAMLYCTKLPQDIRKRINSNVDIAGCVNTTVEIKDGILDCSGLIRSAGSMDNDETLADMDVGKYNIPLLNDGKFSGSQVLAAFFIVIITCFWIEKRWNTHVAVYDVTMPQSVLMC